MDFSSIKIEDGAKRVNRQRYEDSGHEEIASLIRSMKVGQSFVVGKEWRARIYRACWKNRPLTVSIQKEGVDNIRVFREKDGTHSDCWKPEKVMFSTKIRR